MAIWLGGGHSVVFVLEVGYGANMVTGCDAITGQSPTAQSMPGPALRLIAGGMAGDVLAAVDVSPSVTWSELVALLSPRVGMPRELLQVFGACAIAVPDGSLPLAHCGLRDQDRVTCLRLPVPTSWDKVGVCDNCRYWRHLFYGYAQQFPNAEWEPVVANCYACGGRPEQPWEDIYM